MRSMREIWFRGKNPDNGKWYEGVYSPYNWDFFGMKSEIPQIIILSEDKYLDGKWIEVIPETVGQYTGLTDKNGKKIFDGDILSAHFDESYPDDETLLLVGNNGYAFTLKEEDSAPEIINNDDMRFFDETFVVIGNVHDNPGLMRGE